MKLGGIKPIQKRYTSKRNLTNYWVFPNSACHHGGIVRGSFALHYSPILNTYLPMDFKKFIEDRLMMKELQLMRAEDNNAHKKIISSPHRPSFIRISLSPSFKDNHMFII